MRSLTMKLWKSTIRFMAINYTFFNINDILYVVIMKPAAQTYNFFIPVEFRTVISNFFYNLRFPIRFVNSCTAV